MRRRSGRWAMDASNWAWYTARNPKAMLLWPFITQRSPIRIFSMRMTTSPAFTNSSCPLELAGWESKVTCHLPFSPSALPFADNYPSETLTSDPTGAQPQMVMGLSRCNTMLLRKMPCVFNASAAISPCPAINPRRARIKIDLSRTFVLCILIIGYNRRTLWGYDNLLSLKCVF